MYLYKYIYIYIYLKEKNSCNVYYIFLIFLKRSPTFGKIAFWHIYTLKSLIKKLILEAHYSITYTKGEFKKAKKLNKKMKKAVTKRKYFLLLDKLSIIDSSFKMFQQISHIIDKFLFSKNVSKEYSYSLFL